MGVTIKWDITYKCNLNCNHCINGKYHNKDYKKIKFKFIDYLSECDFLVNPKKEVVRCFKNIENF